MAYCALSGWGGMGGGEEKGGKPRGTGKGPGRRREGAWVSGEEGGGGEGAYTLTCNDSASLCCLACRISAGKIPSSEAEQKVNSNLRHIV